jgi:hypothetical protein
VVVIDRAYAGAAASTIINTSMTATVPGVGGTITVADDSGYPASGKFEIVVDRQQPNEENILISSRSGTTFTIGQRGYDGSVASAHTSGEATCEADLSGRSVQLVVDHVDDVESDPHSTKLLNNTRHDVEARHTFGAAYGTPATPTALTPDIAGNAGSGNNPAREDHAHNVPAAVVGNIAPDDVAAEGAAATFARSDHTHGITAAVAGTVTPDASPAEGVATSFARSDHAHGAAAATATTITGSNAEGASSSFARADHNHAYGAGSVGEAAIVDTMPRGIIGQDIHTSDSAVWSADADTDLGFTNLSVIQNHVYRFELRARAVVLVSVADGIWAIELHVNGTKVGEFDYLQRPNSRTSNAAGTVEWTAPATLATDDFVVHVNELAGTSTLQFEAAANNPRWLSVTDLGVI